MAIIQVVIGIIFVLLLLSLLATTIMELLSSLLSLRGRNLEKALRNMLATTGIDDRIFQEFRNNSLYRQITQRWGKNRTRPSYVSDDTFQSILFDIILKGEGLDKLQEKVDQLPDVDLKNVLNQLLRDADHDVEQFKLKVRKWYNDVMDRASGWYKRSTQQILIVVGLIIALVFNADTIAIYQRLEADPASLQQIVTLAENFVAQNDLESVRESDPEFETAYNDLKSLINNEINAVRSPLGLGWTQVDFSRFTIYDWFIKVMGWLVTALAISLGAPFWFDLLRKIVNIRSSGNKPQA